MVKENNKTENPDIINTGQEEANNASMQTEVQASVDRELEQAEIIADKVRLSTLEQIQAGETDKTSKVAKDRKKEIDALKRKIKSQEEVSAKKSMDKAKARVGEHFEYESRDGSIATKKAAYKIGRAHV